MKLQMLSKLLFICLALTILVGCPKAKKPEELPPETGTTSPVEDTTIQSKDMSYDAQGSDSGNISGLYSIYFDYDKATLTAEGRSAAQKNADWLKANEGATLQIEGHCDRHGSIEYNLALGERRAKTVKNYITNLGISPNRLTTISYGKEKPLDSSESESADAKNRRANFVVQGR
jgi:peptidoglycan-associated lipoprotein